MKKVYVAVLSVCLGAVGVTTLDAQQQNTNYGAGTLTANTSGSDASAFGYGALSSNTTGNDNTAAGAYALYYNTTGEQNTAVGVSALLVDSTGYDNTALGLQALFYNNGNGNTATGLDALLNNSTGNANTASGEQALYLNTAGNYNTSAGFGALYGNTTGYYNIGIGYYGGQNIKSGSFNIAVGNTGTASDKGVIRIGTESRQTSFYAAGISGVQISDGVSVYINSNGQLGTVNSSIRFKEDVHDMANASDKLFQLRPVTYRYKQAYPNGTKPIDYGLIAEEVALVYPDMVARDESGEIMTVQYQKLTPMLLNEVQKQHHRLEAQQSTIDALQQRLSALESAIGLVNPDSSTIPPAKAE